MLDKDPVFVLGAQDPEMREIGVLKEMFKGGSPAAVEAFMAEHREAGRSVYGNPHRGYAGAYWGG